MRLLVRVLALSLWGWGLNHTAVMYHEGVPGPRDLGGSEEGSACSSGNGYACPHHMMLSADMVLAAMWDGNDGWAHYAVGGAAKDSDCGACFQVSPLDAETVWNDSLANTKLIVQAVNSGFDVLPGQLDIFMGAGGFGYFTACNTDCASRHCSGGPCHAGMYAGTFDDWVHPEHSDPNPCYSGGIKWLRNKEYEDLLVLCEQLTAGKREYKDIALWQSCAASNWELYHQNFVSSDWVRVRCPEGLVRVTGMRRQDDVSYPVAGWDVAPTGSCRGNRAQGRYCITTMMDCCKPSCSWSGKVPSDPEYSRVDTCGADGMLL